MKFIVPGLGIAEDDSVQEEKYKRYTEAIRLTLRIPKQKEQSVSDRSLISIESHRKRAG